MLFSFFLILFQIWRNKFDAFFTKNLWPTVKTVIIWGFSVFVKVFACVWPWYLFVAADLTLLFPFSHRALVVSWPHFYFSKFCIPDIELVSFLPRLVVSIAWEKKREIRQSFCRQFIQFLKYIDVSQTELYTLVVPLFTFSEGHRVFFIDFPWIFYDFFSGSF